LFNQSPTPPISCASHVSIAAWESPGIQVMYFLSFPSKPDDCSPKNPALHSSTHRHSFFPSQSTSSQSSSFKNPPFRFSHLHHIFHDPSPVPSRASPRLASIPVAGKSLLRKNAWKPKSAKLPPSSVFTLHLSATSKASRKLQLSLSFAVLTQFSFMMAINTECTPAS
jgi:hypothetical protein